MSDGSGRDDDLPDWPDDVVIPDDLSALLGDAGALASVTPDRDDDAASPADDAAPSPAAAPAAALGDAPDPDPVVRTTAVVLTTVRQAKVLAGLMTLAGISAACVPSPRGAIAVRYVEQEAADVDPSEALSGIPREAEALGAALSVATRSEVVLLAARVNDVDGEITGQVKARRYRGGQIVEDPPPGLVLAQADQVAERLLIGLVLAPQVPGYISSADLTSGHDAQRGSRSFFGRRRKGADDEQGGTPPDPAAPEGDA